MVGPRFDFDDVAFEIEPERRVGDGQFADLLALREDRQGAALVVEVLELDGLQCALAQAVVEAKATDGSAMRLVAATSLDVPGGAAMEGLIRRCVGGLRLLRRAADGGVRRVAVVARRPRPRRRGRSSTWRWGCRRARPRSVGRSQLGRRRSRRAGDQGLSKDRGACSARSCFAMAIVPSRSCT